MPRRSLVVGSLSVLAGLIGSAAASAQAPFVPAEMPVFVTGEGSAIRPVAALTRSRPSTSVPFDQIPILWRDSVARVVQQPTLTTHATAEEFRAGLYDWLLDHPDRTSAAWRRLGIPCSAITDLGQGRYGWMDGQGSDLTWRTVVRGPDLRIWYADGHAKPGPVLPLMPARAVAVLRCTRRRAADGQLMIAHEVDVYLQTDSKAAALLARLLGPAAPRLAEQGAEQLLLFFSGMARYLDQHPDEVPKLLGN